MNQVDSEEMQPPTTGDHDRAVQRRRPRRMNKPSLQQQQQIKQGRRQTRRNYPKQISSAEAESAPTTPGPAAMNRRPRKGKIQRRKGPARPIKNDFFNSPAFYWSFSIILGLGLVLALIVLWQVWSDVAHIIARRWPSSIRLFSAPTSSASQPLSVRVQHAKLHRHNATKAPIVVVGLPKAGTSSLFEYFRCLGIDYTQHWYCCGKQPDAQSPPKSASSTKNDRGSSQATTETTVTYMSDCLRYNLQNKFPLLDGCGDFDIYTELNGPHRDLTQPANYHYKTGKKPRIFLPQYFHLKELHEAAPAATWILNTRPVEDWIRSVQSVPAHQLTHQFLHEITHFTNLSLTEPSIDTQTFASPREKLLLDAALEDNSDHRQLGAGSLRRPAEEVAKTSLSKKQVTNEELLRRFWDDHLQKVQGFTKAHPSHRLVIVDIANPDAGFELASDLGWLNSDNTKDEEHTQTDGTAPRPPLGSISPSRARACWKAHNVRQHG